MSEWIKILFPGIVTVILNILFYLFIKNRVEKSLERDRITFSGLFLEKINIYRKLLELAVTAKRSIVKFQHDTSSDQNQLVQKSLNQFSDYARTNEPFMSKEIIKQLERLHADYKDVFLPLYLYDEGGRNEYRIKSFRESIEKLADKNTFKELEDSIIEEMRRELRTDVK